MRRMSFQRTKLARLLGRGFRGKDAGKGWFSVIVYEEGNKETTEVYSFYDGTETEVIEWAKILYRAKRDYPEIETILIREEPPVERTNV